MRVLAAGLCVLVWTGAAFAQTGEPDGGGAPGLVGCVRHNTPQATLDTLARLTPDFDAMSKWMLAHPDDTATLTKACDIPVTEAGGELIGRMEVSIAMQTAATAKLAAQGIDAKTLDAMWTAMPATSRSQYWLVLKNPSADAISPAAVSDLRAAMKRLKIADADSAKALSEYVMMRSYLQLPDADLRNPPS
jgi:hypothetical protein